MATKSESSDGGRERKQTRNSGKQPSLTLVVGEDLEYRIMRLFVAQGYVARRGIEIYTDQYLNRATDLDVIALRFLPPFRRYLQIAECKSGANKPLDRIFWLSGVKSYSHADSATFVRDNSSWDIKDFARRNSVELLDKRSLTELEQGLSIDSAYWPGLTDKGFVQSQSTTWTTAIRQERDITAFYTFLVGEFRWDREMASIRYIIFMMRRLTRLAIADPKSSVWRMLIAESFVQLCIFNLCFAGRTLGLTASDIDALARKELKYGTLDTRVVERMLNYAMKLSEQVLESLGISGKRLKRDDFAYPEPPHADETLKMFRTIQERPRDAVALASFADYVLSERYIKESSNLPWLAKSLSGASLGTVSAISQSIATDLEGIDAVPPGFTELFEVSRVPGTSKDSKGAQPPVDAQAVSATSEDQTGATAPQQRNNGSPENAPSDVPSDDPNLVEWEGGDPPRLI